MKPSFNVNVDRTDKGRAGFRWNYRERKVGEYLTLHCPLQTRPTERRCGGADMVCWETSFRYEPREYLTVLRETHLYSSSSRRRMYTAATKRHLVHKSWADLRGQYSFSGGYVQVKDLGNGLVREQWKVEKTKQAFAGYVRHVLWKSGTTSDEQMEGPPAGFDLSAFHVDLRSMIDGCAAQGRFDVLMDWFIETAPECVARLFDSPGPV